MAAKDKSKKNNKLGIESSLMEGGSKDSGVFTGLKEMSPRKKGVQGLFEKFMDLPLQQQVVCIGAGIMVFLNTGLTFYKKAQNTKKIDAPSRLELTHGKEKYGNPHISWYEKLFCIGSKVSNSCNQDRFLHPLSVVNKRPVNPTVHNQAKVKMDTKGSVTK